MKRALLCIGLFGFFALGGAEPEVCLEQVADGAERTKILRVLRQLQTGQDDIATSDFNALVKKIKSYIKASGLRLAASEVDIIVSETVGALFRQLPKQRKAPGYMTVRQQVTWQIRTYFKAKSCFGGARGQFYDLSWEIESGDSLESRPMVGGDRLKFRISEQELQVARLVAEGYTSLEIADELDLTVLAVRSSRDNINKKVRQILGRGNYKISYRLDRKLSRHSVVVRVEKKNSEPVELEARERLAFEKTELKYLGQWSRGVLRKDRKGVSADNWARFGKRRREVRNLMFLPLYSPVDFDSEYAVGVRPSAHEILRLQALGLERRHVETALELSRPQVVRRLSDLREQLNFVVQRRYPDTTLNLPDLRVYSLDTSVNALVLVWTSSELSAPVLFRVVEQVRDPHRYNHEPVYVTEAELRKKVEKLPAAYRAAVRLRLFERLSRAEVAERLGYTETSVASRQQKGMGGLAHTIDPGLTWETIRIIEYSDLRFSQPQHRGLSEKQLVKKRVKRAAFLGVMRNVPSAQARIRQPTVDFVAHGKTYAQIAKKMNVTEVYAKSLVSQGVRRVREKLKIEGLYSYNIQLED